MKNIRLIFVFCLLIPGLQGLHCQKINTDSLYSEAQRMAKVNDYTNAIKLCSQILSSEDNDEVRFYLGLIYSWDKKYDEARNEFSKVLSHRQLTDELAQAIINNEVWAGKPLAALETLDKALSLNPNQKDFLYQKAYLLYSLKRFDEAALVLEHLQNIDPENEKAKALAELIKIGRLKNSVMADYTVDFIDSHTPWHLVYLQYSRVFPFGTLIGRVSYANRFRLDDFQYEIDAYINTWKRSYVYFNAGVSGKLLFPELRSGVEIYQGLNKSFEVSLGLRYMQFTASEVFIYTGSVSRYFSSYWLSLRPYIIPNGEKVSYTGVVEGRRFFKQDLERYLAIQYSYGSSPDDVHTYINEEERLRIRSSRVKLTYSHRLLTVWTGAVSAAYEREENPKTFNKYMLELRLQRLF